MLKTLLKMFVVLVALAGVVVVYISLTTTKVDTRPAGQSAANPAAPAAPAGGGVLGAGDRPWIRQYDSEGNLAFQFRAADYTPQGNNVFKVADVECEFFLRGGRLLRVTGAGGEVVTPGEVMERQVTQMQGRIAPPTSGVLRGVKIMLFDAVENPQDAAAPASPLPEPTIAAELDNLSFDNETFRIFTDRYTDASGTVIPADRVPIVMVGKDIRFEGYGLTVRLNERDRQLALLEVRHGKRLILNRAGRLVDFNRRAAVVPGATAPLPEWWGRATAQASASQATASQAAPAAPVQPAKPKRSGYRAVLLESVQASQGGKFTATGDELNFLFSGGGSMRDAQEKPAAATAPSTATSTATAPAAAPVAVVPSSTQPTATPAAEPVEEPVIVTWTGPLRVTSYDEAPTGDDFEMSLIGRPAVVLQRGNVVKGWQLLYRSVDDSATLVGDAKTPLVVTTPEGATIASETVRYSGRDGRVRLEGRSRAQLPVRDGGQEREVLASWSRSCDVVLQNLDDGKSRFRQVSMAGDVKIDHPQMVVSAGKLEVEFDETGDEQGARRIVADDDARFSMADASAGLRELAGQRIEVMLEREAGGTASPRLVQATGDAVARDAEQSLAARQLTIELAAVGGAGRDLWVPRVLATGDVLARSSDGSRLSGDWLQVLQSLPAAGSSDSSAQVEVRGRPFATVETEGSVLSGAVLKYDDKSQTAEVVGSGRVVGRSQTQPGRAAQPFEATWSDGMKAELASNIARIKGNVRLSSKDQQGAANTATAATVEIDLADAPPNPAAANADKPRQAGLNTGLGSSALGSAGLSRKVLQGVRMIDDVKLQQLLLDGAGELQRQVNFQANQLTYFPTGLVESAGPGRALLIDRRSAGVEQAAQPADNAQRGALDPASARGTTALGWEESFKYDPAAEVVSLRRDVRVAFQPAGEATVAYRLSSDTLDAQLAGAVAGGVESPESQLSRVRAAGNMVFTARGMSVFGDSVEFDPAGQIAEVRGAPGVPVEVLNEAGDSQGRFSSARFNLKTGQIEGVSDFTGEFRQSGNSPLPGGQPRRVTPIPPPAAPRQ
jgi:lipopolysaccharide export system protein LptA